MREEARKLIEMVKKGVPEKEIMEKLGIQTKASLRKMYYDALVKAGKIKDIITEREAGTTKTLKIAKTRNDPAKQGIDDRQVWIQGRRWVFSVEKEGQHRP